MFGHTNSESIPKLDQAEGLAKEKSPFDEANADGPGARANSPVRSPLINEVMFSSELMELLPKLNGTRLERQESF